MSDLVFFDPDNGFEIPSCRPGRKNSSKYLGWSEARRFFRDGHSVLVYQHFRREERSAFIARMLHELRVRTGAAEVMCFRTANVAFLLAARPEHVTPLKLAADEVERVWHGEIGVTMGDQHLYAHGPRLQLRLP